MGVETRSKRKVLLVDDDQDQLRLLSIRLKGEGYIVEAASSGRSALAALPTFRPHIVVTDVRMDGMDGLALFEAVGAREPTLPVVMLTAHGTIADAIDATQRGVYAYLTKPYDKHELIATIERASSVYDGALDCGNDDDWRSGIVSQSSAMEKLLREARMVARTGASVLITGQSGTGKELLAQAIHRSSPRAARDLVPVNCTAIPEQLFESELFGHVKGAFTGATGTRQGLVQAADGGTLFLDEIGDMPIAFQAKLLRVLQEREIRPVGSARSERVDVRVISATHRNIEEMIAEATFREDLYYRLNVVTLEIPPLAQRRQDIPLLVEHFLREARAHDHGDSRKSLSFSRKAIETMVEASWPGNVRQLRNVVDQCVALATGPVIPGRLVERALRTKNAPFLPFAEARNRFELEYLTHLLETTGGNVAQAARLARRNRSEFYKLLNKHSLKPELFRREERSE